MSDDYSQYAPVLFGPKYVEIVREFNRNADGSIMVEGVSNVEVGMRLASTRQVFLRDAACEQVSEKELWAAYLQHCNGNWGEASPEIQEANYRALMEGGELRSEFHSASGVKISVVTPCKRTHTSIQLVHESPVPYPDDP